MSRILAAIGGTGQEIALACLRLCHVTNFEIPKVYVFDSDSFDPDTTKGQKDTRSHRLRELGRFFESITRNGNPVSFQSVIDRNYQNETVASLFSSSNVLAPETSDLLDLLISKSQQVVPIIDGFHGEPSVGAIAFADAVSIGAWREFEERLNDETQLPGQHFVLLAGGTAGGTGPGVLPVLAGEVMDWKQARKPDAPKVNISLVVQLPWFRLAGKEGRDQSDIEFEEMQRNSACLVKQYDTQLERLGDRVVLMGLQDIADRKTSGPHHQPEEVHYLNLVSGWLSAELLADSETQGKMLERGVYALASDDNEDPLGLTLTGLTEKKEKRRVRLREALQAASIAVVFCETLDEQCRYSRDVAVPSEVWRLAARLGSELGEFQKMLRSLGSQEKSVIEWFSEVYSGRTSGPFVVSEWSGETGWRIAARRAGLPTQKHNLVARVIRDGKFLQHLGDSEAQGKTAHKTGDLVAAAMFSELKSYLVSELVKKGGTTGT
jgi:hypothetical protein